MHPSASLLEPSLLIWRDDVSSREACDRGGGSGHLFRKTRVHTTLIRRRQSAHLYRSMGGGSSISASGQYVDLETCRQLSGTHFDESEALPLFFPLLNVFLCLQELFNVFAVSVVSKNIVEQLIRRPTIEELRSCKSELGNMIRSRHCAPILVFHFLFLNDNNGSTRSEQRGMTLEHMMTTLVHRIGRGVEERMV
jgi:hypothetical protein